MKDYEQLTQAQKASRRYYLRNKENIKKRLDKQYQKEYRDAHKEKQKEYRSQWGKENKEKIATWLSENQIQLKSNRKVYNKKNRKRQTSCFLKRYHSEPQFRILHLLRSRLNALVKKKEQKTLILLGCTLPHFESHIENLFKEGMNWGNYGKRGWHLDHIKPCKLFDLTDKNQQKLCFHYTNLQPLWCTENLKKGCKIISI